ncbi:hypothetical protein ACIQZO_20745 [Streptomyces sp. NPDC097617]|uniref:hypothetical protein n=1 Tax=Streptomyces sp. NPDC097617 TaxID=3366091 RepID=UPI0037F9733C
MTLSRTARWTTGWLLAAAWALSFPLFSSLGPHRLWGWCAAAGYLGAAAATALGSRRTALAAALLGAVGVPLLWLVLPGALLQPTELWRQVFAFPTGRAEVPTPASSPLPGHLLAELGFWGWYLTASLLMVAGLAVAFSLCVRPPRTVVAAADRLALGLTLAFLLAPTGRFGYLALPVLLVVRARSVAVPGRSRVVTGSSRLRLRLRPSGGRPKAPNEPSGGHFA